MLTHCVWVQKKERVNTKLPATGAGHYVVLVLLGAEDCTRQEVLVLTLLYIVQWGTEGIAYCTFIIKHTTVAAHHGAPGDIVPAFGTMPPAISLE